MDPPHHHHRQPERYHNGRQPPTGSNPNDNHPDSPRRGSNGTGNWIALATYKGRRHNQSALPTVVLVHGSVVHFAPSSNNSNKGCIVNAANENCLTGGGIDGIITAAGGPALCAARRNLPVIAGTSSSYSSTTTNTFKRPIRCRTGSAVMTGPGLYGTLKVPYVIHAVGPDYTALAAASSRSSSFTRTIPLTSFDGATRGTAQHHHQQHQQADALLYSAYTKSLDLAHQHEVDEIAVCLLSAGVYRGSVPLRHVIAIGLNAIASWRPTAQESLSSPTTTTASSTSSVSKIFLVAYTVRERDLLVQLGKDIFGGVETNATGTLPSQNSEPRPPTDLDLRLHNDQPRPRNNNSTMLGGLLRMLTGQTENYQKNKRPKMARLSRYAPDARTTSNEDDPWQSTKYCCCLACDLNRQASLACDGRVVQDGCNDRLPLRKDAPSKTEPA